MAFQRNSRNRRKARRYILQMPRCVVHSRVQAVGPEHFAFLCIDCAKARSKIMLADFYGRVLIEPTTIAHDRFSLEAAVQRVRDAKARLRVLRVVVGREGLLLLIETDRSRACLPSHSGHEEGFTKLP